MCKEGRKGEDDERGRSGEVWSKVVKRGSGECGWER